LNIIPLEQMLDLLDHYGQGMHELNAILDKAGGGRFSEVKTFTEIGAVHNLSDIQLAAPIPRSRKNLMCLGWNYAEHAQETALIREQEPKAPEYAVVITNAQTTVNSPYGN